MNILCTLLNHKWQFLYKTGKYCYYVCSRCGREAYRDLFTFKEKRK